MLETLITSKTRIKLLIKFFLNPLSKSYLRALEAEFGEGSNAIRLELNKFEEASLLTSEISGNRKFFKANANHPLFDSLHSLVKTHLGIDSVIDQVVTKLGNLHSVYLTGELAMGVNSSIIDLVLVGNEIKRDYLSQLVEKAEHLVKRKIRYAVYTIDEFSSLVNEKTKGDMLMIWNQ